MEKLVKQDQLAYLEKLGHLEALVKRESEAVQDQ